MTAPHGYVSNGTNAFNRETPQVPVDLTGVPVKQLRKWVEDAKVIKMMIEGQLSTPNRLDQQGQRLSTPAYKEWKHRAILKARHMDADILRIRGELARREEAKRAAYLGALLDLAETLETGEGVPLTIKQAAGRLADALGD